MPADADYTMVYPDTSASVLRITSAVALTATRNLIAPQAGPPFFGFEFTIENATTGSQAIVVKGSTGTGVTIPNGQAVQVIYDGTNYISVGAASSSSGGFGNIVPNPFSTIQAAISAGGGPVIVLPSSTDRTAYTNPTNMRIHNYVQNPFGADSLFFRDVSEWGPVDGRVTSCNATAGSNVVTCGPPAGGFVNAAAPAGEVGKLIIIPAAGAGTYGQLYNLPAMAVASTAGVTAPGPPNSYQTVTFTDTNNGCTTIDTMPYAHVNLNAQGLPTGNLDFNNWAGKGCTAPPTQGTVSGVTGTVTFSGGSIAPGDLVAVITAVNPATNQLTLDTNATHNTPGSQSAYYSTDVHDTFQAACNSLSKNDQYTNGTLTYSGMALTSRGIDCNSAGLRILGRAAHGLGSALIYAGKTPNPPPNTGTNNTVYPTSYILNLSQGGQEKLERVHLIGNSQGMPYGLIVTFGSNGNYQSPGTGNNVNAVGVIDQVSFNPYWGDPIQDFGMKMQSCIFNAAFEGNGDFWQVDRISCFGADVGVDGVNDQATNWHWGQLDFRYNNIGFAPFGAFAEVKDYYTEFNRQDLMQGSPYWPGAGANYLHIISYGGESSAMEWTPATASGSPWSHAFALQVDAGGLGGAQSTYGRPDGVSMDFGNFNSGSVVYGGYPRGIVKIPTGCTEGGAGSNSLNVDIYANINQIQWQPNGGSCGSNGWGGGGYLTLRNTFSGYPSVMKVPFTSEYSNLLQNNSATIPTMLEVNHSQSHIGSMSAVSPHWQSFGYGQNLLTYCNGGYQSNYNNTPTCGTTTYNYQITCSDSLGNEILPSPVYPGQATTGPFIWSTLGGPPSLNSTSTWNAFAVWPLEGCPLYNLYGDEGTAGGIGFLATVPAQSMTTLPLSYPNLVILDQGRYTKDTTRKPPTATQSGKVTATNLAITNLLSAPGLGTDPQGNVIATTGNGSGPTTSPFIVHSQDSAQNLTITVPNTGGGNPSVSSSTGTIDASSLFVVDLAGTGTSCLEADPTGNITRTGLPCGSGTGGGVTSVGLTGNAAFNITGSPITSAGTINIDLKTETATGAVNAVLDCGLKGDAVTDDSAALQACIDAHPGRRILLPKTAAAVSGDDPNDISPNIDYFMGTTTIHMRNGNGLWLEGGISSGGSIGGVFLSWSSSIATPLIEVDTSCDGCRLSDLVLQASGPGPGQGSDFSQCVNLEYVGDTSQWGNFGVAHGVVNLAFNTSINYVTVDCVNGNGFVNSAPNTVLSGNIPNNWYINGAWAGSLKGNGFVAEGLGDAGLLLNSGASFDALYGFNENSSQVGGNTYVALFTNGNGSDYTPVCTTGKTPNYCADGGIPSFPYGNTGAITSISRTNNVVTVNNPSSNSGGPSPVVDKVGRWIKITGTGNAAFDNRVFRPTTVSATSVSWPMLGANIAAITTGTITFAVGVDVLNPAMNYRTVNDAITTAGSATLTSAHAQFNLTAAGSPIAVAGAGPSGATLITTIASVEDSQDLTLAVAASTAVTNAEADFGGGWGLGAVSSRTLPSSFGASSTWINPYIEPNAIPQGADHGGVRMNSNAILISGNVNPFGGSIVWDNSLGTAQVYGGSVVASSGTVASFTGMNSPVYNVCTTQNPCNVQSVAASGFSSTVLKAKGKGGPYGRGLPKTGVEPGKPTTVVMGGEPLASHHLHDFSATLPTDGQVPIFSASQGKYVPGTVSGGTGGPPTGPAGGDLAGTYPNPSVSGLHTKAIPALASGYLHYNGTAFVWDTPTGGGGFTAGGDLSGTATSQQVIGIHAKAIPALASGYLHYNGTAFVWDTPPSGGSPVWSSIGNPTANLSLTMGANTTDFNWQFPAAGGVSGFTLRDNTNTNPTSATYMFRLLPNSLNTNVYPMIVETGNGGLLIDSSANLMIVGGSKLTSPVQLTTTAGSNVANAPALGTDATGNIIPVTPPGGGGAAAYSQVFQNVSMADVTGPLPIGTGKPECTLTPPYTCTAVTPTADTSYRPVITITQTAPGASCTTAGTLQVWMTYTDADSGFALPQSTYWIMSTPQGTSMLSGLNMGNGANGASNMASVVPFTMRVKGSGTGGTPVTFRIQQTIAAVCTTFPVFTVRVAFIAGG